MLRHQSLQQRQNKGTPGRKEAQHQNAEGHCGLHRSISTRAQDEQTTGSIGKGNKEILGMCVFSKLKLPLYPLV